MRRTTEHVEFSHDGDSAHYAAQGPEELLVKTTAECRIASQPEKSLIWVDKHHLPFAEFFSAALPSYCYFLPSFCLFRKRLHNDRAEGEEK
jgi:hypothetical protein